MKKIDSVRVLSVGTAAVTETIGGLAFLAENNSESAVVYFREKRADGAAATASNGFALAPGEMLSVPVTAEELSLVATAADTDVRLLILDEC